MSKSDAIVEWTVKLLSKMAFDFSSLNLQTHAWEWFTEGDPSILSSVFELFQKDTDLFPQTCELLVSYSKSHLIELLDTHLRENYNDDVGYWEMLTSFLPSVTSSDNLKEEIKPFIDEKVQEVVREFESYANDNLRAVS